MQSWLHYKIDCITSHSTKHYTKSLSFQDQERRGKSHFSFKEKWSVDMGNDFPSNTTVARKSINKVTIIWQPVIATAIIISSFIPSISISIIPVVMVSILSPGIFTAMLPFSWPWHLIVQLPWILIRQNSMPITKHSVWRRMIIEPDWWPRKHLTQQTQRAT